VLGELGGGGIGFAIKLFTKVTIEVNNSQNDNIDGAHSKIAGHYIRYLKNKYKISEGLNVQIEQPFDAHMGLSSSAAVAIGTICCINKLFSLGLSCDDVIFLHSSNIVEEHNKVLSKGFLSGVSSWAMCLGGMVIVDTNGSLMGQYKILEHNTNNVLITSPKETIGNTLENEEKLLKGEGTKLDLRDKVDKSSLFLKIKECFDIGDQETGFKFMNQFLSMGSKIAEIEYQNNKYNGLISALFSIGKENYVHLMGMSAIGPSVFFVDNNSNINKLIDEINNRNLQVNLIQTSFYNASVALP